MDIGYSKIRFLCIVIYVMGGVNAGLATWRINALLCHPRAPIVYVISAIAWPFQSAVRTWFFLQGDKPSTGNLCGLSVGKVVRHEWEV